MALSQAEKDQLVDWAARIDRAGTSAALGHQRQLAAVVTEIRAVADGTKVGDLADTLSDGATPAEPVPVSTPQDPPQ